MVAQAALSFLEAEANGRQRAGGKGFRRGTAKVEADLPQPSRAPQARDLAAKLTGASPRAVQDAKLVLAKRPELAAKARLAAAALAARLPKILRFEPELRRDLRQLLGPKFDAVVVGERSPLLPLGEAPVGAFLPDDRPTGALKPAEHLSSLGHLGRHGPQGGGDGDPLPPRFGRLIGAILQGEDDGLAEALKSRLARYVSSDYPQCGHPEPPAPCLLIVRQLNHDGGAHGADRSTARNRSRGVTRMWPQSRRSGRLSPGCLHLPRAPA